MHAMKHLLLCVLLLGCLYNQVAGNIAACSSFFPVSTYTNITKVEGDSEFKISLVGSYVASSDTEIISMIHFAADYLNNQTDILPNVAIQLVGTEITGVVSNTILAGLAAVQDKSRVMLGGAPLTSDAETQAVYAIAQRYNLLQVAPLTNSDIYDNFTAYPNLVRPIPVSAQTAAVVAGITHYFGWLHAVVLIGDDQNGADAYIYLNLSPYSKVYYNITYNILTIPGTSTASTDAAKMVQVKDYLNQTHIIFMCLPLASALRMIPLMNASGFVTQDFVYIFCDQITKALEANPNALGVYDHFFNGSIAFAPKALGFTDFYYTMNDLWMNSDPVLYPGSRPPRPSSWWAFESMWMVALAVDGLVNSGVPSDNITTQQLVQSISQLDYFGVTGHVKFNFTGQLFDRLAYWDIFNYYNRSLIYKMSMSYDLPTIPWDIQPGNFTFFNGRTDIPIDFTRKAEVNITYNSTGPIYVGIGPQYLGFNTPVSSGFGAVVGVCTLVAFFAAFVLATKGEEFQMYGGLFCSLVIFGAIVAYAGAYVVLPRRTTELCIAFPWLVGMGFNIVYGCLFTKIFKFYRVFKNSQDISLVKVSPAQLLGSLTLFLLVEAALMVVWTIVDPPYLKYIKMSDSTYELQCHNTQPIFWSIFLGYKGLWVIWGGVLAILSRHYIEEATAEYKSIAYALYNSLGLFVVGVPVGIGLSQVPSGTLIIEVALVVLCFTFTLVILFFDIWYKIFFAHKDIVGQASKSINSAATRKPSPGNSSSPASTTMKSARSASSKNSANSKNSKSSRSQDSSHSADSGPPLSNAAVEVSSVEMKEVKH